MFPLLANLAAAAEPSSFASVRTEYDATLRIAKLYITNIGTQPIIGGAVLIRFRCADGSELPVQREQLNFLAGQNAALKPKDVYLVQKGVPSTSEDQAAASVDGKVVALIFLDNTAAGDSGDIDTLFEAWRDAGTTLAAWDKKADALLPKGSGRAALEKFRTELSQTFVQHPSGETRARSQAPAEGGDALIRDPGELIGLLELAGQIQDAIEGGARTETEGVAWFRDYLGTRAKLTAAHAQRKEPK